MRAGSARWAFAALIVFCLTLVRPAAALVTFTGYADLEYDPWAQVTLNSNIPAFNETLLARSFSGAGIGLFADTDITDDLKFRMDVIYNDVGYQVGQLQLPYAYLDYTPLPDTEFKGGRVVLPFGYYNENYFYPFQRYAINPPIFESAIFGLPFSDWGAVAQHSWKLPPFTAEATAYTVNGIGSLPTSDCAGLTGSSLAACNSGNFLRFASPSSLGSITLVQNSGATASNDSPAWGGRLRLIGIGGTPLETGFSYYYHQWNAEGTEPLQLADAHVHYQTDKFDFLWEGLDMNVRGDQGFLEDIGSPNYETLGFLAMSSYQVGSIGNIPVILWGQGEDYRTQGLGAGDSQEKLSSLSGGVDFQVADHVRLKTQYIHFFYRLPLLDQTANVRLTEDVTTAAVVITF